jgi:hypothetical protein
MASPSTYRYRFGGRMAAYKLIGYQSARFTDEFIERRRRVAALRAEVMDLLRQGFADARVRFVERKWSFRVRGHGKFMVVTARPYETLNGLVRWKVTNKWLLADHAVIVIRFRQAYESIRDFVVYWKAPKTTWGFTLPDDLPNTTTTVHDSVNELVEVIVIR